MLERRKPVKLRDHGIDRRRFRRRGWPKRSRDTPRQGGVPAPAGGEGGQPAGQHPTSAVTSPGRRLNPEIAVPWSAIPGETGPTGTAKTIGL